MGDRYRHPRSNSPTLYHPARASLPINVSGYGSTHERHMHVVPTGRREIIPGPRTSNSSLATSGPITTTTYKISSDPPARGSSVRDGSRTRRSTLENNLRPQIVTASPRGPIVHSGGGRPASPITKNPYRSSEEEFYSIPATSRKHGNHLKRYSATMDNADMNRLARAREDSHLQPAPRREVVYAGTRGRPVYSGTVVPHRHADTVADDYGDNGYGYTNPRDLVQYDLSNNAPAPARHHSRRDSFGEGRRERPNSITSYNDVVPRGYEQRERGPPPTMRGFDRIPARAAPTVPFEWERPEVRMPVAPTEPILRPAPFEPIRTGEHKRDSFEPVRTGEHKRDSFEPVRALEPQRREPSRRPVSLYHDREPRRGQREDWYEARDDDPRHRSERHRHEPRYDDPDQRAFGVRPDARLEKPDRPERPSSHLEKPDRPDHPNSRLERPDRPERPERSEKSEKKDDHKGRDALATGLSIAGAALGVKAFKDATSKDDREEDQPRRRDRDFEDEPRRRRDPRDDREPVDISGRDPKERRRRDDSDERDAKERSSNEVIDLSGRDPKERHHDRDSDADHRSRHPDLNGTAISSREDSSASDEAISRRRPRRESGPAVPFNPKDTMDLKALKEALNSKNPPPTQDPLPAKTPTRTPRESMNKSSRELTSIRTDLANSSAPRIVTPPPPSATGTAPVKGILRAPREKFPEDPVPIREGVAPLKDAKKDGVPPDARWTKISRKLVNPEALEAGKERYEAREDFVIVLRVLSRDEVQKYAEITERIRAAREEAEETLEREARRRSRRENHERHKRERSERGEREPSREERRERRKRRDKENRSNSETDSTDDEDERPKMLEGPVMSGGLGDVLPQTGKDRVAVPIKRDSK